MTGRSMLAVLAALIWPFAAAGEPAPICPTIAGSGTRASAVIRLCAEVRKTYSGLDSWKSGCDADRLTAAAPRAECSTRFGMGAEAGAGFLTANGRGTTSYPTAFLETFVGRPMPPQSAGVLAAGAEVPCGADDATLKRSTRVLRPGALASLRHELESERGILLADRLRAVTSYEKELFEKQESSVSDVINASAANQKSFFNSTIKNIEGLLRRIERVRALQDHIAKCLSGSAPRDTCMADPPTGEDPGPVCAKWEVTPGSCGSKNFPTFPEKSFRDREAALADIGCALSAVELLEDPRLPAEPSGADVDKARVSLSAHLEPLRPPCTAPTCTVPASVLRPLVQLRGEVNWPLDPHPSLSIGAALETGIALGELASIPDQDRIRAAGSFVARERENAALGPLGATMEVGFARAPFLAYESPGASPYRASAALQIHHAKALGPSARVLFRLWLDRPLGDGQARDGGALVLEFLSR